MGALKRSFAETVRACVSEGEIVALAGKLVSIPSYHGLPKPGGNCLLFARIPPRSRWKAVSSLWVKGNWNVLASIGDEGGGTECQSAGEAGLLLNGHLDTVGVDGMEGDPFSGAVVNGMLTGKRFRGHERSCGSHGHGSRGAASFRCTFVEAAPFLRGGRRVVGSTGTRALLESGVRARYAIVGEHAASRFITDIEGSNGSKSVCRDAMPTAVRPNGASMPS